MSSDVVSFCSEISSHHGWMLHEGQSVLAKLDSRLSPNIAPT